MQAALHQDAGAAKRDRLVDLFGNFLKRADVSVGGAGPPIKRTKRADDIADVCVIDISVNDVSDYVAGMLALANLIGRRAHPGDVVRLEQRRAVFAGESFTVKYAIQNWLN